MNHPPKPLNDYSQFPETWVPTRKTQETARSLNQRGSLGSHLPSSFSSPPPPPKDLLQGYGCPGWEKVGGGGVPSSQRTGECCEPHTPDAVRRHGGTGLGPACSINKQPIPRNQGGCGEGGSRDTELEGPPSEAWPLLVRYVLHTSTSAKGPRRLLLKMQRTHTR